MRAEKRSIIGVAVEVLEGLYTAAMKLAKEKELEEEKVQEYQGVARERGPDARMDKRFDWTIDPPGVLTSDGKRKS